MSAIATLDEKVLTYFANRETVVHKGLSVFSSQFRRVPRFVSDYLIAKMVDPESPSEGLAKIEQFLKERYVDSDSCELIKSRIRERGRYSLFGQVRARFDQSRDAYWAEIPALNDQYVRIERDVLHEHGEALLVSGAWGSVDLAYDTSFRQGKKQYPFVITKFVPLQVTSIDLDDWAEKRRFFTREEWIDLVITSVGFNPEGLDEQAKTLYLCRLLPLVEANVNLVELGPPESGKTFTYRSLSSYSFVVSGAETTPASLFYNKLRRKLGCVGHRDCVMLDEISDADPDALASVANIMKDFMNDGRFGRGVEEFSSECGIVFGGNIKTDRQGRKPDGYHRHLFSPLPRVIGEDRAFLDRIHGYLPGWLAPQVSTGGLANGYGWMADYWSEIMHRLRRRNFAPLILDRVSFRMGNRNQIALTRMASGLLKLACPHALASGVDVEDVDWAMRIATDLRQRVLDQLAIISPGEFRENRMDWDLKM